MTYLAELADRLRANGIAEAQVRATVDELAAHLDETGADPVDEFGPVAEFAAQLGGSRAAAAEPEPDATTWRWMADVFVDRDLLARFGAQGWEMQRIDRTGGFVCHRDPERPQQWEYRRETAGPRGRKALVEQLAPEGWEPCGSWLPFQYFKRPAAASVGPAAELAVPPEVPARRTFLSPRFWILVAVLIAAFVAVVGFQASTRDDPAGYLAGSAVGAVIGIGVAALALRWFQRRGEH